VVTWQYIYIYAKKGGHPAIYICAIKGGHLAIYIWLLGPSVHGHDQKRKKSFASQKNLWLHEEICKRYSFSSSHEPEPCIASQWVLATSHSWHRGTAPALKKPWSKLRPCSNGFFSGYSAAAQFKITGLRLFFFCSWQMSELHSLKLRDSDFF